MLYADDAGNVSRSSERLERMMTVMMPGYSEFGLMVCEAKTETMCLQTKCGGKVSFTINTVGQVCEQTIEFVHLGGAIISDRKLTVEITRRPQRT